MDKIRTLLNPFRHQIARLSAPKEIRTFLLRHMPLLNETTAETVWQEWLAHKQREVRDLYELTLGEYHLSLRARAILILVTPNLAWLPFDWQPPFYSADRPVLSLDGIDIAKLPPELQGFLGEAILVFFRNAKRQTSEQTIDLQEFYNKHIPNLLGGVPGSLAQQLFDEFLINDVCCWNDMMETASGYNPLKRLLTYSTAPEPWRVLADQKMRVVVASELSGASQPRDDHEDALYRYVEIIGWEIFRINSNETTFSVGQDLFTDQVRFLMTLPFPKRKHYQPFRNFPWGSALTYLNNQNVAHHLVRHAILKTDFAVHSTEGLVLASKMLEIATDHDDTELFAAIINVMERGKQWIAEYEAGAHAARSAEETLLAKMKAT